MHSRGLFIVKLANIIGTLEQIAPLHLAESWDNVGLLAGDADQNVTRVLLTIDLTEPVFAEAQAQKANLIVAYHPPIWEPIKRIVAGRGQTPALYDAIRSGMAIYALHTALDVADGGVNDRLAEIVGISCGRALQPRPAETGTMCKLAVFVPEAQVGEVSDAIFGAGGGNIGPEGKYSRCSFRTGGTGTFQCGLASKPAIGKPGSFEEVDEFCLETVVPADKLADVVNAVLAAHPYEEVAYDVFPVMSGPFGAGLGRFGDLQKPTSAAALIETIKKELNVKTIGLIGPRRRSVKRAAVAAGSCGSILREVIAHDCDFYLTGELKHHHALELQRADVTTVCVSHSVSERIILPRVAEGLRRAHKNLRVTLSKKDRDPFTWCQ